MRRRCPAETVSFAVVSHDEALAALEEQEAILAAIDGVTPAVAVPVTVVVDGESLEVVDEQGERVTAKRRARRGRRGLRSW